MPIKLVVEVVYEVDEGDADYSVMQVVLMLERLFFLRQGQRPISRTSKCGDFNEFLEKQVCLRLSGR